MHLFIYSFNQNGTHISVDVLNHIYLKIEELEQKPDIIILGFQESRFGFEYYLPDSKLHNRYELIHKIRLNGIGNVGIRGLGLYICKIENLKIPTEFIEENWVRFNYQYLGKGAISIVLKIQNCRFLFINTHMPYHSTYEGGGIKERIDSLNVIYDYIISKTRHNYLFMLGDFNFRLHVKNETKIAFANEVNSNKDIFELYLKNKTWKVLFYYDELYILSCFYNNSIDNLSNKKYGEEYGYQLDAPLLSFYKYLLDKPAFSPSYKVYNNRTDIQDMKNKTVDLDKYYSRWNTDRTPCWCDRILTANYPGINRLMYTCDDHSLINLSDHLPVLSLFHIDNRLIEETCD
jgi:hypothetical protein